jgi:hypothetical protein
MRFDEALERYVQMLKVQRYAPRTVTEVARVLRLFERHLVKYGKCEPHGHEGVSGGGGVDGVSRDRAAVPKA